MHPGNADSSHHAGEKKKRLRRPSAKVLEGTGDKDEDVGKGPSTKKAGEETGTSPVTGDQMECLIKVVEHMADNMASLATFTWSYETYVKERFEFLALEVPSDWDTTDEEDREVEGLDDELEGLREEEEESQCRNR
ncbi:hypothetical protein M404DRAFT_26469 [Pisolithus tinctorius Marx 270]|uniref:Uncharacterized protein n=1 Tax=Pisolithus tinctorius Marx 270 TaxID=870435 RepID=A0A0C3K3Z4_PISTI|nr:hypothetical protein M404DRAFT_26469 [Pisolithus tinctorius Marx 270]